LFFFFSSRRRHTRSYGDWSSDVCSSDLPRANRQSDQPSCKCRIGSIRVARHTGMPAASAAIVITAPEAARSITGRTFRERYQTRSEERRVGKECRARRAGEQKKKRVKEE